MSTRVICGAVISLLVIGCDGVTLPEVEADATGVIEAVNVSASIGTPNILVDHDPQIEGGSKTVYAVGDADIAVRGEDGSLRRGAVDELEMGQHVNVWTVGVRLSSAPGMMTAVAVEIRGEARSSVHSPEPDPL